MKITLLYKYIKYDIEQLTHRYGEARMKADPDLKDLAQFGEGESDDALMRRYTFTGTAKLRRILNDYLEKKTEDANDTLVKKESWSFTFTEEIGDSHGLAELMHWFVVKFAVWEWCKAFSPADSAISKAELDDIEDDLEDFMGDSAMPMKERRPRWEDVDDVEIIYKEED